MPSAYCAQLTRDLLAIAKLLFIVLFATYSVNVNFRDYYVAHYVWPYHETVRMSVCPSVCLSVTCHISKTEPDKAIVTMDHYIEVGCN